MTSAQRKGISGVTLVEACFALGVLTMLIASLTASGIYLMRITRYNMVASEARLLGQQSLEEIAADGGPNIIMQVPFPIQTNWVQGVNRVVRTVDVTGHSSNLVTVSDLRLSSYLEIHVNVVYESPVSKKIITNGFSTLVSR